MTKDLFNYYDSLKFESLDEEEVLGFIPLHTQPKNLDLKEELSNYKPEFLEGEDVY